MVGKSSQARWLTALVFALLLLNNMLCLVLFHGQLSQLDKSKILLDGKVDKLNSVPTPKVSSDASFDPMPTNNTVLEYFNEAKVKLHDGDIEKLPTWSEIESLIGKDPKILGLDRCESYRNSIPPLRRMLGASGMFNSGTNLITRLLKENCVIPERYAFYGPSASKEKYGIRWQVPWGKHTVAKFRQNYSAPLAENITKEDALPVVTIRNPYDWMISMCGHSYTAQWSRYESGSGKQPICPHLVYTNSTIETRWPVEVTVKLASQYLTFNSLAHLWNEWYEQYEQDSDYPFIIVRFEDIVFRQYSTTQTICSCAGGETKRKDQFKYIVNSAKQGPGHGKKDERTDMVHAWIKYGKPKEVKSGYSDQDWEASLEYLSRDLMEKLGYQYPPSE